jgi:hypothetical protein
MHIVVAKPRLEVVKHTIVVERDNLLGYLKLFPEDFRVVELLNEVTGRLPLTLRGLTEKCRQEADTRQRSPADNSKCARHNQKSSRSFQSEFYDAFASAQSCFL